MAFEPRAGWRRRRPLKSRTAPLAKFSGEGGTVFPPLPIMAPHGLSPMYCRKNVTLIVIIYVFCGEINYIKLTQNENQIFKIFIIIACLFLIIRLALFSHKIINAPTTNFCRDMRERTWQGKELPSTYPGLTYSFAFRATRYQNRFRMSEAQVAEVDMDVLDTSVVREGTPNSPHKVLYRSSTVSSFLPTWIKCDRRG